MPTDRLPEDSLRVRNEREALRHLLSAGASGLTRTKLADRLGVSVGTVVHALKGRVAPLLTSRRTEPTSRSGPRPMAVSIDTSRGSVLGLDFGETYLGAGLVDLGGEEIAPRRYTPFRAAHDHIGALRWMRAQAEELVSDPTRLVGVGISVAAPVNPTIGVAENLRGVIRDHRALPDWAGINPAHELAEVLNWRCPFALDNDANLAALAELRWGAARGMADVLFVKWTGGIGAALILDGELHRGTGGIAGELGHTRVQLLPGHLGGAVPVCSQCEQTCLESVASVPDLLRDAGITDFDEGLGLSTAVDRLIGALRAGDRTAEAALARACEYIGHAIGATITMINPEAVVIGGDFDAQSYDLIGARLRTAVRASSTDSAFEDVSLMPGEQTGRASILGAAVKVLDDYLLDYAARLSG